MDSQHTTQTTTPEWCEWVEAPDNPERVIGVKCSDCGEEIAGTHPKPRDEQHGIWSIITHADECEHAQEYQYPELPSEDLIHLSRQYELYGRERVLKWVRGKVALPTDLELKKLDGEEIDEEAYYQSATDYYLGIDSDEENCDG